MFRILLKKQIFEAFRSWFFNPKTGKARTKAGTVGFFVFFFVLMVGVLGGMFSFLAWSLCEPLIAADVAWMYFDIFGLLSIALGLFGSVFNTFAGLYLSKDNDLLLSMPIPVGTIIASRIANVYLMGVLYSSVVFLPAIIVYQVVGGFRVGTLLSGIAMWFEITLYILVLACLLGWVVAQISLKLKHRSFVTVLATLVFLGLYYFIYFKATELINDIVTNAAAYGEKIKGAAYVLYSFGQNGEGKIVPLIVFFAVAIALTVAVLIVLSRTYIRIATATPKGEKGSNAGKSAKVRSIPSTLLSKEWSRFLSNATYMLNCGLGAIFAPIAGVALLVKHDSIETLADELLGSWSVVLPVGVVFIVFLLCSMIDTAVPSVSLEGKSMWQLQSLPIDPWQVIRAKITVQLLMTLVPTVFFLVCVAIAVPMTGLELFLTVFVSLLYSVFCSLFCMLVGLKSVNLNWSNEIVPIKSSSGPLITIFGGWGFATVFAGGYALLTYWLGKIPNWAYLGGFAVVIAVSGVLIYLWLKNKGSEIIRNL